VIGADGQQFGVLATDEALRLAEEAGLDLVEVSPKAIPPVCKIMDYGKFKYENSKKTKEARKHQSVVTLKEIKFRPKTDDHDFDFKVKNIRRFIQEGNKAKLVVIFRGREIVHPETGHDVLKRVIEVTSDISSVEQVPVMDGRRMMAVLAPRASAGRPPQAVAPRPVAPSAPAPTPAPAPPAGPQVSVKPPSK
jgi:translation initiation factor IF-3